jgi:Transposase zinc-binding domain
MNRPRLDVAEVIRSCSDEFLEEYGAELTPEQRRALGDLTACRTAALGGHVLGCPECGHQEISYNSCGNRPCPKCHGTAAAPWLAAQAADVLDVPYYAQQDVMLSLRANPLFSRDSCSKSSA